MVEISHPIFGRVGHVNHPELKSETVPAEPFMVPSDLKSLIECGKISDEVEVDGHKFGMSTMSDELQEEIFRKFSEGTPDAAGFVNLRRTVVAVALETFNGRPFGEVCKSDDFESRMKIVKQMQGNVIDRLYTFYDELLKRSRARIEPEQVKNS